jgi:Fic family protein
MTYVDKLKITQKATDKTQTELAGLLDVSFPTLNSWLNKKSVPRKRAQEKIDFLYQEYTGVASVDNSELANKKREIGELKKSFSNPLKKIVSRKDLYDTFVLELTYHTNSIEGSTLNEPEVRAVLFDNATIPNKTMVEHQEAKNHQAALGNLFDRMSDEKARITEDDIKKLHSILMNGIWPSAGQYRDHQVRIAGSKVVTANYMKVEELMKKFVKDLDKTPVNVFSHLAKTHAQFEKIHPFSDGNGRIGRLLMHYIAIRHGLPPILVKKEKKQAYYTYLQRAQTKGEYVFLESFICDSLLESYGLVE